MTTQNTDQITLDDIDPDGALGRIRTARKPWRCVCADRLWGYRIETRSTMIPDEFSGWRSSNAATRDEAEAEAAALVGKPSNVNAETGEARHWYVEARVVERLNPDHRPDCLGDIAVGDRYFEYLGEAMQWESGSRYCARCAVAVWGDR